MDTLPTELRHKILQNCTVAALKCIRLTSRSWASLGFEYLIPSTFTTLPHRPDFTRLLAVSKIPNFSKKIFSLFINLGEFNEYHARHNSYFIQYMRDADLRYEAQDMAWGPYAMFKIEKEKHMLFACSPELLGPALKNLPHLKKVDVSLSTFPFSEDDESLELLRQIWNIPSTRLFPRVATTERFTALCSAMAESPARVEELSHDRLPFEFFTQRAITISLISTVFVPLTKLNLVLDYSDMPNNLYSLQTFQNLSHCLRSASRLQLLSLSFQGRKKIDISPLLASFTEHEHTFEKLQDIKFEGVRCTEDALVKFLTMHKESLKRVQLGGIGYKALHQKSNGGVHLGEGTWKETLKRIQEVLHLERKCFLVQGDMVDSERAFVLDELVAVEDLVEFVSD